MDSTLPIIEIITFHANERCLEDLGLFKEVRDMVAATTSVKSMYWGRSIELPSVFIWLLLWDSFEQSTAREETPSHTEMVRKLDALADDSKSSHKRDLHVRFSEWPTLPCIEAPVTEFDIAILKDLEARPTFERLTTSIFSNMRAAQLEGFHSLTLGTTLGDPLTSIYFGGWDSVEDHMKLGTQEGHEIMVKEIEEVFLTLRDLHVIHVRFERHV